MRAESWRTLKKFPMPVNDVSIVFVQNVYHHALSRGFEMKSYSNENKSNSSAHMNNSTSTYLLNFFNSKFGDRNVFKGVKGYLKPSIVLLSLIESKILTNSRC